MITYVSLTVGNASSLGEIGPHAGLIRVSTESSDNIDTRSIANRIKACISEDWQNRLEKFSVARPIPAAKATEFKVCTPPPMLA